jgi:hypothetical protein
MISWPDGELERAMTQENEYIRRLKELLIQSPEGEGRYGTIMTEKTEHDLRMGFRTEYIIGIRCQRSVADVRALAAQGGGSPSALPICQ